MTAYFAMHSIKSNLFAASAISHSNCKEDVFKCDYAEKEYNGRKRNHIEKE